MSAMLLCEVDLEVADREEFGRRAVEWAVGGGRAVAGDLLARVSADASVAKGKLSHGAQGPAGAEWGFVTVGRVGKSGMRQSGRVIDELAIASPEKEAPKGIDALALGFTLLDASGDPADVLIRFEAFPLEDVDRWCRFTIQAPEDYAGYTDERVEAVWRALAPVLLKGTPSRDRASEEESPVRLVFRDAAEVAAEHE
jgi:hypothetical protein